MTGQFKNWDQLLLIALRTATSSPDPSTQNAALIVNPSNGEILTQGVNRFPDLFRETDARWQRPIKYNYVEHAERNAIYQAAKLGISTNNMIMVCPWYACADCGRAIIQAGLTKVIGLKPKIEPHGQWGETIIRANEMLDEAGIERIYIDKHFGVNLLRNGKLEEF